MSQSPAWTTDLRIDASVCLISDVSVLFCTSLTPNILTALMVHWLARPWPGSSSYLALFLSKASFIQSSQDQGSGSLRTLGVSLGRHSAASVLLPAALRLNSGAAVAPPQPFQRRRTASLVVGVCLLVEIAALMIPAMTHSTWSWRQREPSPLSSCEHQLRMCSSDPAERAQRSPGLAPAQEIG